MGEREQAGGGEHGARPVVEYASVAAGGSAWSGLAVASLACGAVAFAAIMASLLGVPYVPEGPLFLLVPGAGMPAVVLGIIDERRRRSSGRASLMGSWGFALGLGAILASVLALTPFSCGSSRERVNRVKCMSNLKQMGTGMALYANDNGGRLPLRFDQLITDADLNSEVFVCPSGGDEKATGATTQAVIADFGKPQRCSYVYRAADRRVKDLPAGFIVAHEKLANHEDEGMNVLYADWHVEWLDGAEAKRIVAELDGGNNPPRAKQ